MVGPGEAGHWLQWGRSSFTAEIPSAETKPLSEGPLQWGRSSFTAEMRPHVGGVGANVHASMGPQFFHCGNAAFFVGYVAGVGRLQWGRSSFTAEMRRVARTATWSKSASMGPQFFHCGNCHQACEPVFEHVASMGPQFFHCGNRCSEIHGVRRARASMGPQFFHCGNHRPGHHSPRRTTRFNGAAVLSLRKCAHEQQSGQSCAALQWGRSSFTAEMVKQ